MTASQSLLHPSFAHSLSWLGPLIVEPIAKLIGVPHYYLVLIFAAAILSAIDVTLIHLIIAACYFIE